MTSNVERAESAVQVVIMLAIGGMAGAASFTHVHDVAVTHGQPDWIGWADATVVELMSVALGLELRRRARTARPTGFVASALVFFVVVSLAAQVVEAERSVIGWLAAALPAIGFLVLAKVVLSRTAAKATNPVPPPAIPAPAAVDHRDRVDGPRAVEDQVHEDQVDEPTPPAGEPSPIDVPRHLLPTARYALVNHEQTTGRAITADELAARMSITPAIAGQLLGVLTEPAPPAGEQARVNGVPVATTAT